MRQTISRLAHRLHIVESRTLYSILAIAGIASMLTIAPAFASTNSYGNSAYGGGSYNGTPTTAKSSNTSTSSKSNTSTQTSNSSSSTTSNNSSKSSTSASTGATNNTSTPSSPATGSKPTTLTTATTVARHSSTTEAIVIGAVLITIGLGVIIWISLQRRNRDKQQPWDGSQT